MTVRTWRRALARRSAIRAKAAILALALLVLAPLQAAPLRASGASAGQAPGKNFIWKATGKGGVVYLAGSIHMLTPDFYPLPAAFDAAFKDSDLLVEEIDLAEILGPGVQMLALQRGMLPGGQTLETVLTPATLALVKKVVADLGAPLGALQQFKPWMLAIALEGLQLAKAGFDPDLGLDKHFYDLARTGGKAVQGLETAEYQISQLDGLTMEQQDRMLATTLKELATETGSIEKLTTAWKNGDAPAIERLVLADLKSEPVLYQRLLVERNRNWLPKIEALFTRKGHALVIVGAAHMVGPDGLLAMLTSKGYTIEQL